MLTEIQSYVKTFLALVATAEVVKIDGQLEVITEKPEQDLLNKVEDHDVILQTEFHVFNWWEITQDCQRLNNREWQIGHNVISFYTIEPL